MIHMAQTTYTIRRGHQYSPTGASVQGQRGDRMTFTRVDVDVVFLDGSVGDGVEGDDFRVVQTTPALLAAAKATIADGQTRTLTVGQPDPICDGSGCANGCELCEPQSYGAMPLCRHCGTVCYGDCTASGQTGDKRR